MKTKNQKLLGTGTGRWRIFMWENPNSRKKAINAAITTAITTFELKRLQSKSKAL